MAKKIDHKGNPPLICGDMCISAHMGAEVFAKAFREYQMSWAEEVISGLLAAGVPQSQISVHQYPERLSIAVRGEELYHFTFKAKSGYAVCRTTHPEVHAHPPIPGVRRNA